MSAAQSEPVFDPFGEPITEEVERAGGTAAGDRMARRIGSAMFWSIALLILAGRIFAADLPVTQTVAAYASKIVALL